MTRKEQKEARRTQIIQAALDLFVERGYYGTKTSQISGRAGISEGLLFHYFPTKEILLEELTKILLFQVEKNPCIAKMFVFIGPVVWAEDIPEKLRNLVASVDTITICQDWVEAGQRDGSIRKGNALSLSNMYWCAIHGIMEQCALRPEIPLPEPKWIIDMLRMDRGQVGGEQ